MPLEVPVTTATFPFNCELIFLGILNYLNIYIYQFIWAKKWQLLSLLVFVVN
jgi:hypothetical protein